MYEVIKKVIESKRYELSDILTKIDTLWVQGSITDEQKGRLVQLAREYANVQASIDVMAKLEELDKRVAALENRNASVDGGETEETESTAPEYVIGKWYRTGDEISFKGAEYVCIAPEGMVCTWNPDEYPAYWQINE